jgi:hypothetical protein
MKAFSRTAPVHPEDAGRDSRIDAFVERYVDWREECEALDSAYRRWGACNGVGARPGFRGLSRDA